MSKYAWLLVMVFLLVTIIMVYKSSGIYVSPLERINRDGVEQQETEILPYGH